MKAKAPVLVGTWTPTPWQQAVPMSYSIKAKGYSKEVWMSAEDMFQIFDCSHYLQLSDFLSSRYHWRNGEACFLSAHTQYQYRSLLLFHAQKTRRQPPLYFQAACSVFPKAGKRLEDAHFLDSYMLGVADGVGGWRSLGIDSGQFALELMQECKAQSLSSGSLALRPTLREDHTDGSESYLVTVAREAVQRTKACGSSTMLICALNTGHLDLLNLGDSRAMVIRLHDSIPEVLLVTSCMQHSFNTPYQVSKPLSASARQDLLRSCSTEHVKALTKALNYNRLIRDDVEKGDLYSVEVKDGDLLIVGTDGLWDNLFEEEVLACVCKSHSAEEIARKLAKAAHTKSRSKDKTPFEVEAVLAHGSSAWLGGKEDDITVLTAWIRQKPLWP